MREVILKRLLFILFFFTCLSQLLYIYNSLTCSRHTVIHFRHSFLDICDLDVTLTAILVQNFDREIQLTLSRIYCILCINRSEYVLNITFNSNYQNLYFNTSFIHKLKQNLVKIKFIIEEDNKDCN